MLVIFARIPVGQLRKLKCLHESEIDEIQGLYTEANSSIWLGWTCSGNTSSDDDDARSQSPIPTVDSVAAETVGARARDAVLHGLPSPDCVITTHSTPTVIRRCAVTECSPDVAALHSLLDRLHSVINVSSCLQALWFLGKKDLNAMRRSALLYGAILRLTLGLRAALSIVGVDTHDDYSNARVWADVLRCKYVTVPSDTDIHYWTAFQPTLLWSGPLAINNASLMSGSLSLSNFSLCVSDNSPAPPPSPVSLSMSTTETRCLSSSRSAATEQHLSCSKSRDTSMHDSSSSAAAVPATVESSSGHHLHAHSATAATALPGMSTGDSGLSAGQSAGQAGQSGQSLLLPRINSGPCTANPLSLESWVLSTSRHSYVDIQRYAPKQSLLHYPVDKQRVTLSTGASSQSSSCQFLDRLAESDAASGTRMCVLARLCSRPLVGQYGEFVKAAQWQTTFLEWIAENSPSAIRSLQDDVRTMRNNGNATASPAFVLQPRNMPCLSPSPTSSSSSSCVDSGRDGVDPCAVPHIDAGAGAAGACDQCVPPLPPPQQHRSSSTCLRGWVMLPAGHLVQDVHSTLDRLLCAATPSCTPSCDTYSPQHRDREQEFVQPDEMVRCLPVFDPSKNEFVPATPERLSRRQLLRQCTTLRSRLSNSFAKLFLLDETPEMLYLKHRRACTRTSSVSTTPTGGNGNISSMDPPIFSDSVKVGQYYMDPLSTVPVKRLLGMFAEDGSVLCPKTLKPLILPEDVDVDYVTSIGGVKPFSHHSVGDRKVHGVEYCMDANDGLQSDAALQRLRDSLNRVMDPTGSAVELKAALSDESDIIPALTGARRSRITTTESTTSSSSSSSSRSSSTGRAKTSATSSSKQSSGRSHILEASGSRSKKQHLTSKSSSLSSSRSSSVSSLGRSLQSSKAVSSPSLSSSSSLSSRDKQQRVGSTRRRHSDQHAASLSSGRRSLSDGSKPSERRTLSSSKAHSLRRDASSSSSSSSSSLLRRRSSTQDSLLTRRSSAREQQTGGSAGGGSSITGSRMETQALMTSSVTSSPPVPPSSAMSSVTSVSSLQLSPNHAGEVSASVPVTATTSTHQGLCKGPALRRHRTTSMNLSSVASSDGALLESPPARTSSADWALPSASVATASTLSSSSPLSTSHLSRVSEHVAPHDCTTPPITSSTSNDDITVSHHDVMMSASQPVASVGTRSHSTSAIDTMLSASQAPAAAATGSHQEDKEAREGRKTTAEQRRQLRVKRSERHKQQLQLVVEHVVMKHGVQRSDRLFQNCANRLFKVSKIFLEDLTTSHNLIAEMKKVAKNNVKQVVQSEFKNAKRSLSVS